jgi:hypothetical protein
MMINFLTAFILAMAEASWEWWMLFIIFILIDGAGKIVEAIDQARKNAKF